MSTTSSNSDTKAAAATKKAHPDADEDIADRFVDALAQDLVPDEILEEFLVKCSQEESLKKARPTIADLPPDEGSCKNENITQPGVIWVNGINNEDSQEQEPEHDSLASDDIEIPTEVLQRFVSRGSIVSTLDERRFSGVSFYDLDDEYLVEAETVVETSDPSVITNAKQVQWWKRYQWCITLVLVLITIGLTLGISFAAHSGDLNSSSSNGIRWKDAIEERTYNLILTSFPDAKEELLEQLTPRRIAFQWIAEQANLKPDFYTDKRILQQYSLVVFFLRTSASSSWNNHTGWMEFSDECEWHGVQCDGGHSEEVRSIIGVHLPSNNLTGSVPSDITILSASLSSLVLDNNRLSGIPSDEIGHLTRLSHLNLSQNQLTGSIPDSIGDLDNLSSLDLSQNQLRSTIPTEIGNLSVLQSIRLGNNQLVGQLPHQLCRLEYLEEIDLSKNELSYSIPTELGNLSLLKRLYLQENTLLGQLPSEISSLSELQVLNLSQNFFYDKIPSELWQIGSLPNIEYFDLSNNLLTGSLPRDFGASWRLLKILRLGKRNFLQGTIPDMIFSSTSLLEELDLSNNFFTGSIPNSISHLHGIKFLDLSKNNLNEGTSEALYRLESLQYLDFSLNKLYGSLSSLIGNLTNLKFFSASDVFGTIPEGLWSLRRLETLRLLRTSLSGTLPTGIGLITSLRKFSLLDNPNISGTLPSEIGLLRELTSLTFASNSVQGSIPTELGTMTRLEKISLTANNLSGTIPLEISKLTSLTYFQLGMNHGIRGTIPTQIGLLTKLQMLGLSGTQIKGSIPSEIGNLVELNSLNAGFNQLAGLVPKEIHSLTKLEKLYITNTKLSGSIPEELCNLSTQAIIIVQCSKIACFCCACPEGEYSSLPSSTFEPAQQVENSSRAPSGSPAASLLSLSDTPSIDSAWSVPISASPSSVIPYPPATQSVDSLSGCSLFQPLSSYNASLLVFEGKELFHLPFQVPFGTKNTIEYYSNITINPLRGGIGIEIEQNHLDECTSGIMPALIFNDELFPRRAFDFVGEVRAAYLEADNCFIISWEGTTLSFRNSNSSLPNYELNFQVVLYSDGRIEMRWGDGVYPSTSILLAGLGSYGASCSSTISIDQAPFILGGERYKYTEHGVWPTNRCAVLSLHDAGYKVELNGPF